MIIYFSPDTIIAFHIGRGGRSNNSGYITFLGEHKIGDFIDNNIFAPSIVDDQCDQGYRDNDDPDAEWTDCDGNGVELTNGMIATGIGRINRDGEYDTTYTKKISDVEPHSKEWDAIITDQSFDAEQVKQVLNVLYSPSSSNL